MSDEQARGARLDAVGDRARGCTRCPALVASRSQVVVGEGAADAAVAVVGPAPGGDEDALGLPLAGRAAALLDQLLADAGVAPGDIWTTTLVKCLAPGGRDPSPAEVASCSEYLVAQLELVRPVVVVALGGLVTKLLRGDPASIRDRRGREEVRTLGDHAFWLLPAFHPAAALYAPALVDRLREDLARLPELVARGHPVVAPSPAVVAPDVLEPVATPGQLELF